MITVTTDYGDWITVDYGDRLRITVTADYGDRITVTDYGTITVDHYGGTITHLRITVTHYGDSALNSHVPLDAVYVPHVSSAEGRYSRYSAPRDPLRQRPRADIFKARANAEGDKEKCTVTVTARNEHREAKAFGSAATGLSQCQ